MRTDDSMERSPDLRRAAFLLSALPKAQLGSILARLSPAEAASVTRRLSQPVAWDPSEFVRTLRAFEQSMKKCETLAGDPTHRAYDTSSTVQHNELPVVAVSSDNLSRGEQGLELLEELPVEKCTEVLRDEEPALLAAVLFVVSTGRRAALVEQMELGLRAKVLGELALISEVPASTVDHIRLRLQRKLEFGGALHARPEGLHRIRQMMERLDPALQGSIADSLSTVDPALAAELHRNVFRFNDLIRLSRTDIRKLLERVDTSCWAPALRHADGRVRQHVLAAMAGAAAKILAEELAAIDEPDPEQSSACQRRIIEILQGLFRQRVISRPLPQEPASKAA